MAGYLAGAGQHEHDFEVENVTGEPFYEDSQLEMANLYRPAPAEYQRNAHEKELEELRQFEMIEQQLRQSEGSQPTETLVQEKNVAPELYPRESQEQFQPLKNVVEIDLDFSGAGGRKPKGAQTTKAQAEPTAFHQGDGSQTQRGQMLQLQQ